MKSIDNTEMTVDVTVTRSLDTKESRIELIEDLSRGYADEFLFFHGMARHFLSSENMRYWGLIEDRKLAFSFYADDEGEVGMSVTDKYGDSVDVTVKDADDKMDGYLTDYIADAVNNGVQMYIDTCVDARTRADIDRLNASFDRLDEFNS